MPASRYRCLSSAKAFAVSATIGGAGRTPGAARIELLDRAGRLQAVEPRHEDVHQDEVDAARFRLAGYLGPPPPPRHRWSTATYSQPHFSSTRLASSELISLSSASRTRRAGCPPDRLLHGKLAIAPCVRPRSALRVGEALGASSSRPDARGARGRHRTPRRETPTDWRAPAR